jgi:hypothetical protein
VREPNDVVTVATSDNDPEYRHLMWRCVGCGDIHGCPTTGSVKWSWNGSKTEPTLSPSILKDPSKGAKVRCHSFVRDGVVEFLGDCAHDLAGQRVRMLPPGADIFAL